MIADHFTDFPDGQFRIVKEHPLRMRNPEIGNIFARCLLIDLTENFCQITGTVIHDIGDQVQINVLSIILYKKIFQKSCNLWGSHSRGIIVKDFLIACFGDLELLFDFQENIGKFFRVDRFQQIVCNFQGNGTPGIFKIRKTACDHKFGKRELFANLCEQSNSIHDRHADIRNYHIRIAFLYDLVSLAAGLSLADYFKFPVSFLNFLNKIVQQKFLVLRNYYCVFHWHCFPSACC